MAANVAVKAESDGESDSIAKGESISNRSTAKSGRLAVRKNRYFARSSETASNDEFDRIDDAPLEGFSETDGTDSSMDRLSAALTDDSLQAQTLPQRSLTPLDAKVRVETLISRTMELLDIGQLEQARRTAKAAHELGESAQLDYSPDEDRPIDLVRRIDGQLESTLLATESPSESDLADVAVPHTDSTSSEITTKPPEAQISHEKDPSALARIRRDWSTLFRREKKTVPADAGHQEHETRTMQPAPKIPLSRVDQNAQRTSESSSRDAVVIANRSVTLGSLESLETSTTSFVPEFIDDLPPESASFFLEDSTQNRGTSSDDLDRDQITAEIVKESPEPMIELDEGTDGSPEFDVTAPLSPILETETTVTESTRPQVIDCEDPSRQSDWTPLYLLFGICSFLAFGCYRRGAT